MARIRKGDQVVVLAGKDKGKRGQVLRVASADRLVVEGVNRVKKHEKPNPYLGRTGGIVEKEMPIHISNVGLLNAGSQKPSRVGFKTLDDGRKVRVFRPSGEMVDA